MKELPIGLQNFKEIIESGYLYVDKTRQIYDLIDKGKLYFLSRPRRFGKSLLLSTLRYIFDGEKDLFKGLYIAEQTDYTWKKHPVLEFNFASYGYQCDPDKLKLAISYSLQEYGRKFGIELPDKHIKVQLDTLVEQLSAKYNRVVILIDEYDKPIIDFIMEPEKAKANSDVLAAFFAFIKSLEAQGYLHFLLVTGVSKFGKMSLFSDLNNLRDLTLSPNKLELTGITQAELLTYFGSHILSIAEDFDTTTEELLEHIQSWYGGYSWNGETKLYNPSSIMSFLNHKHFGSFGFATNTPTFLVKATRNKHINPDDFEQIRVHSTFFNEFSIAEPDMAGLLFQAGYLTISKIKYKRMRPDYFLSYPNKEMYIAFTNNLLE